MDAKEISEKFKKAQAAASGWIDEALGRVVNVGSRMQNPTVKTASVPSRTKPFSNNEMHAVARLESGTAASGPRDLKQVAQQDKDRQIDSVVAQAREMLQEKVGAMSLTGADIYYLKADINRWDDQTGKPQTGRIAFQIPFQSPYGDPRTIYANVDLILGDLLPPRFFTDGLNKVYAFDETGMKEMLKGSEFETVESPKIKPQTTFTGPEFHAPDGIPGAVAAVDSPMIFRQASAQPLTKQAGPREKAVRAHEGQVRPISKEATSLEDRIKALRARKPAEERSLGNVNPTVGSDSNTGYPEGDQAPGKSTMAASGRRCDGCGNLITGHVHFSEENGKRKGFCDSCSKSKTASVKTASKGMTKVLEDLALMDMRMVNFRDLVQMLKQHGGTADVSFESASKSLADKGIVLFQTAGESHDNALMHRLAHTRVERLAAPAAPTPVDPTATPERGMRTKPGEAEVGQTPESVADEEVAKMDQGGAEQATPQAQIVPPSDLNPVEFKDYQRIIDEYNLEWQTIHEREMNNIKNGVKPHMGIDYTNLQILYDKIDVFQTSSQSRKTEEVADIPSELAGAPKAGPAKPMPEAGAPGGAPAEQTMIPEKGKGLASDRRRVRTAVRFDTPADIDDDELEGWVLNDEGLYNWCREEYEKEHRLEENPEEGFEDTTPIEMGFIERHRQELQEAVFKALNPKGHEYDQPDPGHKHWIGASVKVALEQALDMKSRGAEVTDSLKTMAEAGSAVAANTPNIDAATGGGTSIPKAAAKSEREDTRPSLGKCIHCGQDLVDGKEESGWTGEGADPMTRDGDFGCDPSPETTEEGVGGHALPAKKPSKPKAKGQQGRKFDQVGAIMAFEQGELDDEGIIELFQDLVNTGMAWRLQGSYGRAAKQLLDQGLISPAATDQPDAYGNVVPGTNPEGLDKQSAYEPDDEAKAQMAAMGKDPGNPEHVKEFMETMRKTSAHSLKYPEVCKNCKYLMVPVGYSVMNEFKHTRLPFCGAEKKAGVGFRSAYFRECAAYDPIAKDVAQKVDVNAPKSQQTEADEKKVVKPINERRAGKVQDWISNKISFLVKEEGLTQEQAVGKAHGMARKRFPGQVSEKKASAGDPNLWRPEFENDEDISDDAECEACGRPHGEYHCRRCGNITCGSCGSIVGENFLCMDCEAAEKGLPRVGDKTAAGSTRSKCPMCGESLLDQPSRCPNGCLAADCYAAALPSADPKAVREKDSQTGVGADVRKWCTDGGHFSPAGETHPAHDWCTLWNTPVENLVMLPSGAVIPKSMAGQSSEPHGEGGPRQFSRDMSQTASVKKAEDGGTVGEGAGRTWSSPPGSVPEGETPAAPDMTPIQPKFPDKMTPQQLESYKKQVQRWGRKPDSEELGGVGLSGVYFVIYDGMWIGIEPDGYAHT